MKAEELKGKSQDELKKALMDARKDQFNARLQRASGQLENTAGLRVKRRDIARIKTALNAKADDAAKPAKAPAKKKSAKA
ncbi:MAG: 50S ribosomal protein L29 [Micavibrio aeruginosavorus]|uniref:Large ribosomal subunit protein uL29 n=1 Tax=Micavibrio aeruginosavorus TaxID=349221 RepID=A0A2W4ZGN5_9BACT|nr:MAG: 50S ribosomal protein L29 [Micavibrio aeruginosavorus]